MNPADIATLLELAQTIEDLTEAERAALQRLGKPLHVYLLERPVELSYGVTVWETVAPCSTTAAAMRRAGDPHAVWRKAGDRTWVTDSVPRWRITRMEVQG